VQKSASQQNIHITSHPRLTNPFSDVACPLCAIIAGDAPATVKHETEAMVCILDAYPVSDGHALLSRERIEHVNGFDAAANSYAITFRTGAVNR